MHPLSKSKILAYRQCPKRLWLEVHASEQPVTSPQALARFEDGHQVGKLAHQHFDPKGKGRVFDPMDEGYDEVVCRTAELVDSPRPLFEAGLSAGGARAYVDVMLPLRRQGQRVWRIVEVKSTTSVKPPHLDDVAIQSYVARAAGIKVHSVEVAHIDGLWEYPGDGNYQGFFTVADLTAHAHARAIEVKQWIADAQATVRQRKEPKLSTGDHCAEPHPCAYLEYCQLQEVTARYPVAWLPRRGKKLLAFIQEGGCTDMREVPDEHLNPEQRRVKTHTLAGTTYFDADAAVSALAQHMVPAYFLDFETISLTIPIWKGVRPFQQIPFQFSVHSVSRTGRQNHQEFLDLSGQDPSRKIAEALVAACGERGPIFVYSSFESTTISALAMRLPKHRRALLTIKDRLVDLLPIVKEHYYHPDQQGSWSIKSVLPTIAPDLRYDALDGAQDGGMAMLAYREAIDPATTTERKTEIRRGLLAYCRLDTLAMVRLWQCFTGRSPLAH